MLPCRRHAPVTGSPGAATQQFQVCRAKNDRKSLASTGEPLARPYSHLMVLGIALKGPSFSSLSWTCVCYAMAGARQRLARDRKWNTMYCAYCGRLTRRCQCRRPDSELARFLARGGRSCEPSAAVQRLQACCAATGQAARAAVAARQLCRLARAPGGGIRRTMRQLRRAGQPGAGPHHPYRQRRTLQT